MIQDEDIVMPFRFSITPYNLIDVVSPLKSPKRHQAGRTTAIPGDLQPTHITPFLIVFSIYL